MNRERELKANVPTGASFGIVPMVNTWNYFTAYMVVSSTGRNPPPPTLLVRVKKKKTD